MKKNKNLPAVPLHNKTAALPCGKTAALPGNITGLLLSCMTVLLLCCTAAFAAPVSKDAKYSVDATEIEYDLKSGDGTTSGKTTIQYDGGVAVAQGGAVFNSRERSGRLYGGVKADKEDNHLQSDELIMYTDRFFSAVGNAVLTKGDKTLKAPRVDYHDDKQFAETLGGAAYLSAADGSWLSAGKIVYDIRTGVANATGGVTMENTAQKMTGSGDRAVYDSHETGYVELIGNARATQDGNTVTGDKLRITNVSGRNSRTHAQGHVRMVYYPQEKKKDPAEAGAATLAQNSESKAAAATHDAAATLAQSKDSQHTKSHTEDKTV